MARTARRSSSATRVTQSKNLSEETARQIDGEIRRIIDEAYARCKGMLSENIDELHLLAKGLLEHETLSGDEIRLVIRGEPVVRNRPDEPVAARPRQRAELGPGAAPGVEPRRLRTRRPRPAPDRPAHARGRGGWSRWTW